MRKGISVLLSLLLVAGLFCNVGQIIASADAKDILGTELFTDSEENETESEETEAEVTEVDLSKVKDEVYLISAAGTYEFSGKYEGQICVDAAGAKIKLILNNVQVSNTGSAAINVVNAKKVTLSVATGSVNTIDCKGEFGSKIDAAIFSKKDLNLKGDGTLIVTSAEGHGIVSKKDLKIKGGSITIESAKKGLGGKNSVVIENGEIIVKAGTDAVNSKKDIEILGGTMILSAGDDAVHADNSLIVSGGEIDIRKCVEGLEGLSVSISGGNISIIADDNGINASASGDDKPEDARPDMPGFIPDNPFEVTEGAEVNISGGVITIVSFGDGIDSNGSLMVTGGELYISGPVSNGDSAIDYASEATISGGKVCATGSSGMAEGFKGSSEQASILYVFEKAFPAGTEVSLKDKDGNVLVSYEPENDFSSVVISAPDLRSAGTYYLTAGDDEIEIEMDGVVFSNKRPGGLPKPGEDFDPGFKPDFKPDGAPPERPDGFDPNGEPPELPDGFEPDDKPNGKPNGKPGHWT